MADCEALREALKLCAAELVDLAYFEDAEGTESWCQSCGEDWGHRHADGCKVGRALASASAALREEEP